MFVTLNFPRFPTHRYSSISVSQLALCDCTQRHYSVHSYTHVIVRQPLCVFLVVGSYPWTGNVKLSADKDSGETLHCTRSMQSAHAQLPVVARNKENRINLSPGRRNLHMLVEIQENVTKYTCAMLKPLVYMYCKNNIGRSTSVQCFN